MRSDHIALKAEEDAPGYTRAASPATSCSTCAAFQLKWCTMYDFGPRPSWTCDSWERRPASERGPLPLPIPPAESVPASFVVFKDAKGRYRWILRSGDAFADREDEVVSTKALERDVARTDRTGEYGPLRWWHVGTPIWKNPLDWRSVVAGRGLDIGDCDFSAMEGPVLIESGTFRSENIAAAIAAKPDKFQASLGFSHPLDEPDSDGVYHHINRFERSLTPANKASNPRTGLIVTKERAMDPKKLAAFKEAVGEDEANAAIADAQLSTKASREAGIREKELVELEPASDLQAQLADMMAQMTSFKEQLATLKTTHEDEPVTPSAIVEKAPAPPPSEEADEEAEEGAGEIEEDEVVYVGDMTGQEFVELLRGALAPLFDQVNKGLDVHGKLAAATDSMKELKTYLGGLSQKDDTYAALQEQLQLLSTSFKEVQDQLTDLTGSVPRGLTRPQGTAYKASEGIDNVVPPTHPMYRPDTLQQAAQSPLAWVESFVLQQHQQQTHVPDAAAVVPLRNGQVG